MATIDISQHARLVLRHIATTRPPPEIEDLARFSRADDDFVAAKLAARKNLAALEELIRGGLASLGVEDQWSPDPESKLAELTDEFIQEMDADEETKATLRSGRDAGVLGPVEIVTNEEAFERAKPRVVATATARGRKLVGL